jgi:hypothetical protein
VVRQNIIEKGLMEESYSPQDSQKQGCYYLEIIESYRNDNYDMVIKNIQKK